MHKFLVNETGSKTIQADETAGGQTGFLWRKRIEPADFPKFFVSNVISSGRAGAWATKIIKVQLQKPGSLSVQVVNRVAGDPSSYEVIDYVSDKDVQMHSIEIDNYWDIVEIHGKACSEAITNMIISV